MVTSDKKRHSKWYEQLVFSSLFQFLLAAVFTIALPAYLFNWLEGPFRTQRSFDFAVYAALAACAITYLTYARFRSLPSSRSLQVLLPVVCLYWFVAGSVAIFIEPKMLKKMYYVFFFLNLGWFSAGWYLGRKYYLPKLAIVPYGNAVEFFDLPEVVSFPLSEDRVLERRFDAVVADLSSDNLTADWQKFLSDCSLAGIPVYNTQQLLEVLTGTVRIKHLSPNTLGTLQPSPLYETLKRVLDTLATLALAPIWLPLMLLVALCIRIESPGSPFFMQERVGRGGRTFKIYKLRSMYVNAEHKGAKLADVNDSRVTRIGRFIRKMRIDELPQFFNVLKGDMSIIGPRPEQRVFVQEFEKDIPFFSYRHVVRPGITGWAQVMQGYAGDKTATRSKLQYDLYYIKNYSFWLDMLIVLKTLRTILTGFGAR